ncbi:MAG: DHH family phosphoesterase [Patescibacteria group bacterium]
MAILAEIQKQILAEIQKAKHIMLVAHPKPDGDAAGSCLAMAHYLEDLHKSFTCFCLGDLSPSLLFLPKNQYIKNQAHHFTENKFDLLIVLDSGDLRYAGISDYLDGMTQDFKIINIDHHPTNEMYGHFNLVISDASSTCEIVYNLLNSVKALNKNISTCLLTGIITDTGGFSNLATSATAIDTASRLLLHGANFNKIHNQTLNNRSLNSLKLWGRALERLFKDPETGFITTAITRQDLDECDADLDACEGVSNFLNTLEESRNQTVMVLSEREAGQIKVSLRTTSPLIDVSKFAKLNGGGGHKKAAGYSIKGSLTKTSYGWTIKKLD